MDSIPDMRDRLGFVKMLAVANRQRLTEIFPEGEKILVEFDGILEKELTDGQEVNPEELGYDALFHSLQATAFSACTRTPRKEDLAVIQKYQKEHLKLELGEEQVEIVDRVDLIQQNIAKRMEVIFRITPYLLMFWESHQELCEQLLLLIMDDTKELSEFREKSKDLYTWLKENKIGESKAGDSSEKSDGIESQPILASSSLVSSSDFLRDLKPEDFKYKQ